EYFSNNIDMNIEKLKTELEFLEKDDFIERNTGINKKVRSIKLTRRGFARYLRKHYKDCKGRNIREIQKNIANEVDKIEKGNSKKIANDLDVPILVVNYTLETFEIDNWITLSQSSSEVDRSFFVINHGLSNKYNYF
ncbi:hypothetical protein, partial [Halanaerobacter jeridensis]